MKIQQAVKDTLNQYPKLKEPFELDSDGLFFLDMFIGKIVKNLVDFYNDYELLIGGHNDKLEISNFNQAYCKILSLSYFLNISENDINNYLNDVCEHHKVNDNMFYMGPNIYERLLYISNMLMQKDNTYPISDYFIMVGDIQIYKGISTQNLVKSILFEIIALVNYSIDIENGMNIEFLTESLINLNKLKIIFKINESI